MSTPLTVAPGWPLWRRQLLAIVRIETRKMALSKRGAATYLLALLPWALLVLRAIVLMLFEGEEEGIAVEFAALFRFWTIHSAIFFSCVAVFNHLFRGEMADRSLHYYFLAPIRRSVLTAGKFLAGVVFTTIVFWISVVGSMALLLLPHGLHESMQYLVRDGGLGHTFVYLLVVLLACTAYGALFLLTGVFLRNPIIPVILLFGWEAINALLPVILKKVSVIFYLGSLCPVPLPTEAIAIVAEPPPVVVSVLVPLLIAAVAIAITTLRVRTFEIMYGTD